MFLASGIEFIAGKFSSRLPTYLERFSCGTVENRLHPRTLNESLAGRTPQSITYWCSEREREKKLIIFSSIFCTKWECTCAQAAIQALITMALESCRKANNMDMAPNIFTTPTCTGNDKSSDVPLKDMQHCRRNYKKSQETIRIASNPPMSGKGEVPGGERVERHQQPQANRNRKTETAHNEACCQRPTPWNFKTCHIIKL